MKKGGIFGEGDVELSRSADLPEPAGVDPAPPDRGNAPGPVVIHISNTQNQSADQSAANMSALASHSGSSAPPSSPPAAASPGDKDGNLTFWGFVERHPRLAVFGLSVLACTCFTLALRGWVSFATPGGKPYVCFGDVPPAVTTPALAALPSSGPVAPVASTLPASLAAADPSALTVPAAQPAQCEPSLPPPPTDKKNQWCIEVARGAAKSAKRSDAEAVADEAVDLVDVYWRDNRPAVAQTIRAVPPGVRERVPVVRWFGVNPAVGQSVCRLLNCRRWGGARGEVERVCEVKPSDECRR